MSTDNTNTSHKRHDSGFFEWSIIPDFERGYFKEYLSFTKEYLEKEDKRLSEEWEVAQKEMTASDEGKEWIVDHLADRGFQLSPPP